LNPPSASQTREIAGGEPRSGAKWIVYPRTLLINDVSQQCQTTLRLENHHPGRKSVTDNRTIFDYTRSLMRKKAEPGYFVPALEKGLHAQAVTASLGLQHGIEGAER
jgi:hypothetical protein